MKHTHKELWDALPPCVQAYLQQYHACVAGGYLRSMEAGEDIHDYDIFILGEGEQGKGNLLKCICSNIHAPGQLVWMPTIDNVKSLLESFDFTICQAAITPMALFKLPQFEQDVEDKVLRLTEGAGQAINDRHPLWSMVRAVRMSARGYHMDESDSWKLASICYEYIKDHPEKPLFEKAGGYHGKEALTPKMVLDLAKMLDKTPEDL